MALREPHQRRCALVMCIQRAVELLLKLEYLRTEPFRLRFWLIGKCTHRINIRYSPLNEVFQESCGKFFVVSTRYKIGRRITYSIA